MKVGGDVLAALNNLHNENSFEKREAVYVEKRVPLTAIFKYGHIFKDSNL